MGHYRSEMYSKYDDSKLRADYEKRRIKEINKVLYHNKSISIKEVKVGDVLVIYDGFFENTKVAFDEHDEPSGDIVSNLHLTWGDIHAPRRFLLDKNIRTRYTVKQVRNNNRSVCLREGMFSLWLDVRYFQKLKTKRDLITEKRK